MRKGIRMSAAVALACVAAILLTANAAWCSEEYVEPVTGVSVFYPDFFSSAEMDMAGQYGGIHVMLNGSPGSSKGNLAVSVKEINAKSIFDVLNNLIFNLDGGIRTSWTLRDVTRRYIDVVEEEDASGEKQYAFHRGWLLDDGSFLHVQTNIFDESHLDKADKVEVRDDLIADRLAHRIGIASEEGDKISGQWAKDEEPEWLEVYGNRLFAFFDESGRCRVYGLCSESGASLRFAAVGAPLSQTTLLSFPEEEWMNIRLLAEQADGVDESIFGEYNRIEKPSAAAGSSENEDGYRGEWVNDSVRGVISINRASIVLQTINRMATIGYEETDEGLRFSEKGADAWVRRTDDGGLTMDGITGVFYRKGSEKANGFAGKMGPYTGEWVNGDTGVHLKIEPNGYLLWGGNRSGFSPGTPDLNEQGRLLLLKRVGVIEDDGRLRIDELGVFARAGADAPEEAAPLRVAAIYEHGDFGGREQFLSVGRYNLSDIEMGNDALSSLKVDDGYRIILFQHADFQGDTKMFEEDASYVGDDFNDEASSLIVEAK